MKRTGNMMTRTGRSKAMRVGRLFLTTAIAATLIFTFCFAYAGEIPNRYTGKTYTHSAAHSGDVLCNGVDVSAYQENIDWDKLKSQGIDFAIVRAGYTGYGTGSINADNWFTKHMSGAKEAGMMLGVYYYSQATTEEEAVQEADYTINLIRDAGYTADDLALPVFMDYEKVSSSKGRINNLSKSTRTKCANAFLEEIALQGFVPGIYTDYSFANKSVDGAGLSEAYIYWAAQYYSQNDFEFNYAIWQYNSSGSVPGSSGRLDMNFWYINPDAVATPSEDRTEIVYYGEGDELIAEEVFIPAKMSLADAACTVTASSYTYNMGKAYKPKITVRYGGSKLSEGTDYRLEYVNNTQAGTAYARVRGIGNYQDYQMISFKIAPNTDISGITVGDIADRKYTGEVNKPTSVKITDEEGNIMKSGIDYTISATNSKDVGTYSLNIAFMGNYSGKKTAKYKIVKATPTIKIEHIPGTLTVSSEDFNIGASSDFNEAELTYKSSDKNVVTINKEGNVSVKGQGNATITVKTKKTDNLEPAETSFDIFVKAPPQKVTTKYSKYNKDVTSGSFCLNAKTDGDGEISYEVETVEVPGMQVEPEETIVYEEDFDFEKPAEGTEDLVLEIPADVVDISAIDMPAENTENTNLEMTMDNTINDQETNSSTDGETAVELPPVVRVLSTGRVIIEGPGTAIIHIRASETAQFEAGEKQVKVVVSDMDAEAAEEKCNAIRTAVEGTTIKTLTASPSKKSVTLKWSKSGAKYGVDFYQVYRSTKKSSGFKKIYSTSKNSEKTYKDGKNLSSNTVYYYKVRGVRYVEGKCVYTPFTKVKTATK